MVGYAEYEKGYKILNPSSQKSFIERSVQFEEEPMQQIEIAQGECSNIPLHDDVSDDSYSNFFILIFMIIMMTCIHIMTHPFDPSGMRKPFKYLGILLEIH